MTRAPGLRRTLILGAAALATALFAAGCGGGDHDPAGASHGGSSTPAATAVASGAAFNDADVLFAQMMIPHHEQAVEMATLAESRAKSPEVKQLAGQIKAAQDPEIKTLTGWLAAWGQAKDAPDGGHDSHGMMSSGDMRALEAATGAEFDAMFADMMIEHHEGAIQMAKDEQRDGANAEAKALAATIEKTQTDEVATLRQL